MSVKKSLIITICVLCVFVSLPLLFLENVDIIFLRQQEGREYKGSGAQKLRKTARADEMANLDYESHYSRALCRCPGATAEGASLATKNATKTTFIKLKKPESRFHSNHWFHIGEYFLSKHGDIETNTIMRNGDTVVLMANEADFAKRLTSVAAFFLLLGLGPDAKRLEVYEPSYV